VLKLRTKSRTTLKRLRNIADVHWSYDIDRSIGSQCQSQGHKLSKNSVQYNIGVESRANVKLCIKAADANSREWQSFRNNKRSEVKRLRSPSVGMNASILQIYAYRERADSVGFRFARPPRRCSMGQFCGRDCTIAILMTR